MELNIHDTFNKELSADPILENTRRQVKNACYSFVTPRIPSNPKIIHVSDEMLNAVGLNDEDKQSEEFKSIFSGATVYPNTAPFAMCYGGHQFGHWAGQLGDGRAINLFEVIYENQRWALQLKGAGATPYSRTADGLAVLRSSIREHLCSEAMYHLGVPTTRSLSLALTGDEVLRDVMYDGHPAYEKGAVVCRISPSFIRFGNFQIFAARQDKENIEKLANYTIKYFFSEIREVGKEAYLKFFKSIAERTIDMIVHWQRVGFVHGVMNTDNMSALGLTIDYGPYGWLEGFDPNWTPNTTDAQGRRYRYGNQPQIAMWNLVQLANGLYPLIEDVPAIEAILTEVQQKLQKDLLVMNLSKLGLTKTVQENTDLVKDLFANLQLIETDMTIFYRLLADLRVEASAGENLSLLHEAFYNKEELSEKIKSNWMVWLEKYVNRLQVESSVDESRKEQMNQVNPKYVLRNYMAQLAIDEADKGNYQLIDELYQLLKNPYDDQPESERWFAKRPDWARDKVGCSMLSCSS